MEYFAFFMRKSMDQSQRNPTQDRWTDSPKCYANIFIDDAALGCPLIETDGRSVVDWLKVAEYFDLEV